MIFLIQTVLLNLIHKGTKNFYKSKKNFVA